MIKFECTQVSRRLYPETNPLSQVLSVLPHPIEISLGMNKCWIAGGFIRRWWNTIPQESDIDLFFDNQESYDVICEELNKKTTVPVKINKLNQTYEIKVTDTWTIKVQAIKHKFYKTTEELLDSFDFTICQFAFDGKDICTTELAVVDSQRKRLVPHKITFGTSSLRRIIKYTQQGYYMCGGAATEFLKQITPQNIRGETISVD